MADELTPGSLGDVQSTLYDLITAPAGVGKRLAELGRPSSDLEAIIKPTSRLTAVERVDIYANMYFYRILDVFRDEYTKVLAVLGDEAFHNVVTDYLLACRPAHPSLREAGARLPAFLGGHAMSNDRLWLAELARLERAHLELYDGPDAEVLSLGDLRALSPEALPTLRLRAVPSHAILRNEFTVSPLWRSLHAGEGYLEAPQCAETLLVWRQGRDVFHRAVDSDEQLLLPLIADGAPFEVVCERVADGVPESEAVQRSFQILGRWVTDGLIMATR